MADRIKGIETYFSTERFVTLAREEFDSLAQAIAQNMRTKTTDSGHAVNAFGLPEETSGDTARSLRTTVENRPYGFNVAFVGRKGIKGIDEGTSPQETHEEWGSFDAFYNAIKKWARLKESKYGMEYKAINAYAVASRVWANGTVLYRAGGGTEILKDLLSPAIERIDKRITEELDNSIYQLLDATIEL